MANYTMPPRLKPSDYAKGKITQDEIIALQIANDKNIANARKAIKMGEPATLLESQEKTPTQLLLDDAQQENDLRKNLERLGLRPQEAIATISAIRNENEDLIMEINLNFPALEADIKKRFNPKLITPTFLVEYFKKYSDELAGAFGIKVFTPNNARLNGNINNLAELRAILPPAEVIEAIYVAAQEGRLVGQDILVRIGQLRNLLPTEAGLRALENLEPVRQQRIIEDLLRQFEDLPPAEEFMALRGMIRGDQIDREEFRRAMYALVDAIPRGRQENIVNAELNLGGVREIIREELARLPRQPSGNAGRDDSSMAQESKAGVNELFDDQLQAELRAEQRQQQQMEQDRQRALDFLEAERDFAMRLRSGEIQSRTIGTLKQQNLQNIYYNAETGTQVRSPNFEAETKGVRDAILAMRPRGAIDLGELSSITASTAESTLSLSSRASVLERPVTKAELKATIEAHPDLVANLRYNGQPFNWMDIQLTQPANPNSRKKWIRDPNLNFADLLYAKFGQGIKPKVGQGVINNYRYLGQGIKPEPRPRVILGSGIAVKETPSYKQYGKYAIHIPQLEQQDMLNVKYKSLGQIPKFKPMAVSDIFRDFILDLLETGKPNVRVYHQVSPQERKVFEEMSIGAGVWNGLGLKRTTISTDEEENKRFELLKGEYLAGNNNPKVISELRRLVVKMMGDGRIRKAQGLELLMELSV